MIDPRQGMTYNNPASDAKGQATVVDPVVSNRFSRAVSSACCYSPAVEREIERSQGITGRWPETDNEND